MTDSVPELYDAVVVGGGAAGFAAATWLARYRRRVAVLDAGETRNRWVEAAHGYLGGDPLRPGELLARAREQLLRYPEAEVCSGRAERVLRGDDGLFVVETGDGPLRARRLVLATGVRDEFPEVERFFEHYGATVFHCPTCDGYEAKDARVVVFGWSEEVTGFALTLLGWAREVLVVTEGRAFEGDAACRVRLQAGSVPVIEDDAVELLGERGRLEGVRLRDAGVVACDLAFFSIAHHPCAELAEQLGCRLSPEGYVEVDDESATSVPGVYAAGDLTPGLQLLQVAAAKGAIAGVACSQSLRAEDPGPEE